MPNTRTTIKIALIFLLGVMLIAGLVYGWVNIQNRRQNAQQREEDKSSMPITLQNNDESQDDLTKGWKVYRNEKYGFELKYPPYLRPLENRRNIAEDHVSFWHEADLKFSSKGEGGPQFLTILDKAESPSKTVKEWLLKSMGCKEERSGGECRVVPVDLRNGLEYFYSHESGHGEGIWHYAVGDGKAFLDFQVEQPTVLEEPKFFRVLESIRFLGE